MYNKLTIFDFDGTLIDTELPISGQLIWKEKTGNIWPHKGWWGRKESLNIDIFDNPVIHETYMGYEKATHTPYNMVVMMTGRMVKLSKEVELILDKYELKFDEKLYNTGGDTFSVKVKQIEKLLEENPDIIEIEIYEDREPHINQFEVLFNEMVSKGVLKSFKINHIHSERFN